MSIAWFFSDKFWSTPLSGRGRRVAAWAAILLLGVLVFARLGGYALWDDEADTALFGQAVWETGDTSAVRGDNLVLYRDGVSMDAKLRNRLVAPLPYYVEAVFARGSTEPFWARLPFALAGWGSVGIFFSWLARSGASRRTWAVAILAVLGNVSWVLYSRQARYYGLALLLSMVVAFAYANRTKGPWALAVLCGGAAALCATHYLCYAGMVAALAADYAIWGRKDGRLSWHSIAAIAASQLVLCGPVVWIWFPLGKDIARDGGGWVPWDRLLLWLRTLRDMNNSEYGVGLLIAAAPLLARRARDPLLLRIPLGILVATVVVTAFSPQPPTAGLADVRYVSFLIPGCVVVGVRAIEALRLPGIAPVAAAIVAFQTTALHAAVGRIVASPGYTVPWRITLASYIGELARPPMSSYRLVADWLEKHATSGSTAVVFPDYATYPLMYHVPKVVYGWQLTEGRAREWPNLAAIHVRAREAPEWLVVFDTRGLDPAVLALLGRLGAEYTRAAALPVTGVDRSRAELFWHEFNADAAYDPRLRVTIWRRVER